MASALRRLPDHALLLPILLGLSLVAWILTDGLATPDMRVGILSGEPADAAMGSMTAAEHRSMGDAGMGAMGADPMGFTLAALGLFMVTWLLMMVAMMFPAVAPVVLTFRRWADSKGRGGWVTVFIGGYLTIWTTIGLAAYGLMIALQESVPAGEPAAARVGGALLIVAGIYQWTPLKEACLSHCRSPLSVLMTHGRELSRGPSGVYKVGMHHGLYCLGCCWSLMVVLVLLGMMNLAWMALIAAFVLAEKVFPRGREIALGVGALLVVGGSILLVSPGALSYL